MEICILFPYSELYIIGNAEVILMTDKIIRQLDNAISKKLKWLEQRTKPKPVGPENTVIKSDGPIETFWSWLNGIFTRK